MSLLATNVAIPQGMSPFELTIIDRIDGARADMNSRYSLPFSRCNISEAFAAFFSDMMQTLLLSTVTSRLKMVLASR